MVRTITVEDLIKEMGCGVRSLILISGKPLFIKHQHCLEIKIKDLTLSL